jgi:electron transport complex protein RnfB
MSLADAIDNVLPQTQCGKCGYPACRPYAEAIAAGLADINQCSPGADEGVADIAAVLGVAPKPVDPRFGTAGLLLVAVIEEEHCIGCTLCIQACPVDAIVGAPKLMHTVIAAACTGCELCVPPCPVDCIRLELKRGPNDHRAAAADARRRFDKRNQRLERARADKAASLTAQRSAGAQRRKKETIARALERARLRIENRKP